MTIRSARAGELLKTFSNQRILVVGDLMWDRYIYGSVTRISPEAPVPVVAVRRERNMPGGASNVAWNVQTLGAHGVACGVLGRDVAAKELKDFFAREGIGFEATLELAEARTTVKTRIIAETQQVVRVDWDNTARFSDAVIARLGEAAAREAEQATGIIIEDYGKGVVEQRVVDAVISVARRRGVPTGYDPKDNHALNVAGVTVATPNRAEAFRALGATECEPGPEPLRDAALTEVGERLLEKWRPEKLLITLGARGVLMLGRGMAPRHVPTRAREVFDVSGAGDTVIAACVLALAAGASFEEAAELANHAAGVVVGHVGTAACSPAELLESIARTESE